MEITYEEEMQNQNLVTNGLIHFDNALQMYDYLRSAGDLYAPHHCKYVFEYNEEGAIAEYYVNTAKAKDLANAMELHNEEWSAFLGPGGTIYDVTPEYNDAMRFCKDWFMIDWYDTIDYKELVLRGLSGGDS